LYGTPICPVLAGHAKLSGGVAAKRAKSSMNSPPGARGIVTTTVIETRVVRNGTTLKVVLTDCPGFTIDPTGVFIPKGALVVSMYEEKVAPLPSTLSDSGPDAIKFVSVKETVTTPGLAPLFTTKPTSTSIEGGVSSGFVSPLMFVSMKLPTVPLHWMKPDEAETELVENEPVPVGTPVESMMTESPELSTIFRIGGIWAQRGREEHISARLRTEIARMDKLIACFTLPNLSE
jgi:hypothetical protein